MTDYRNYVDFCRYYDLDPEFYDDYWFNGRWVGYSENESDEE